jgi:hypothetical protein
LVEFALVLDGVFAGDDGVLGPEAVFDGVLGTALFTLIGSGTGGVLCVLFVGSFLCS